MLRSASKKLVLILMVANLNLYTVDCTFQYSYSVNSDLKVVLAKNNARNPQNFFFVTCSDRGVWTKADCNVTVSSWGASDSIISNKSCEFHSGLSKRQWARKSLPIQLYYLGRERALVIWDEIHDDHIYKKIVNINMTTCAKKSLYFSNTFFKTYVIVHEKSFEVITSDPQQCSITLEMCRLIYDERGVQLRYVSFPAKIQSGSLEYFPSDRMPEGFIFRQDTPNKMKYINSTGGTIQLHTIGLPETTSIASSTAYSMYAICGIFARHVTIKEGYFKSIVRCHQFKAEDTRPKFHVNLEISESVKVLSVHNLEEGGFLLATLECSSYLDPTCRSYTVSKYKPGGIMTTMDTKNLDFKCSGKLENLIADAYIGTDGICFHFSCVYEIYTVGKRVTSVLKFYELC